MRADWCVCDLKCVIVGVCTGGVLGCCFRGRGQNVWRLDVGCGDEITGKQKTERIKAKE